MKVVVTFSGGKDSLAALLWIRNNFTKDFITVFCDTGWESPVTYQYIDEIADKLNLNLVKLKSKRFDGMIDMVMKKSRFPSSRRRFCTSELKVIPMIDFLIDVVDDDFVIVQGIRGLESKSRSKMLAQCNYFKYYLEPSGKNKKGENKFHTYRKKDVLSFCKVRATDVLRPVFDWTAQQVIDYILENGLEPNPLYRMGFKRVGCFPCIMSSHPEIYQITQRFPERMAEIAAYETLCKSSFFGPDSIPRRYYKGSYPVISDVAKYIQGKHNAGTLFEEYTATSCMSYYGLCE
jgi:3'-phosphoadenosine 5'-phosphosulfate sulfotransferase (PAPS reductase)/FAD synthetase